MKALGLNQAYILLKLRNNYYLPLICSFGLITGNILQLCINKKFIRFFFLWITRMIFDWYWKRYGYWKWFWKYQHFADIKCSLLDETYHFVKTEIFSIKLWGKMTKLYPMTIISSDHRNEIQYFRNHLTCPWILKIILRNKWFNPPAQSPWLSSIIKLIKTFFSTLWLISFLVSLFHLFYLTVLLFFCFHP